MVRAYSLYRAWCSWWARVKSCCWVGAIVRRNSFSAHKSERVSYWNFLRYPSGAYHGAIAIIASNDGAIVPEITWHIRHFADLSTADMFTKDQVSYGAEYNWFSLRLRWLASTCCMYLTRATIDCSRFTTKVSSTSTTMIQIWCINVDITTTTLALLRIRDVVQFNPVVLALVTTAFTGHECF